jgi:hypothetical protein
MAWSSRSIDASRLTCGANGFAPALQASRLRYLRGASNECFRVGAENRGRRRCGVWCRGDRICPRWNRCGAEGIEEVEQSRPISLLRRPEISDVAEPMISRRKPPPARSCSESGRQGETVSRTRGPCPGRSDRSEGSKQSSCWTAFLQTAFLPDDDGAKHRQRKDGEAEIHPSPIRTGVLGQPEQIDNEPGADANTHQHANKIAWRLIDRRKTLDLRACDTRGQYSQNDQE